MTGDRDVEFDAPDEARQLTLSAEGGEMSIEPGTGDEVRLVGTLELVGDDGVLTGRLGTGLILIELSGPASEMVVGQSFAGVLPRIDLHPYQL